jgi:hypothetical protein
MTAFTDFVNLELPRRSALLTKAITGYDGNPNSSVLPAINNAPLGTWFYEETAQKWWRKKSGGSADWVYFDISGGGGGTADLIRPYAVGVSILDAVYQKADGNVDKTNANALATSEAFLGFVATLDSPGPGQCEVRRFGDLAGYGGLTTGETYILSTTTGGIVALGAPGAPSYPGAGGVIRPVAVAASALSICVIAGSWLLEL